MAVARRRTSRSTESRKVHWQSVYRTKGEDELSWHQDEPELSLRLVRELASLQSRIVDVGGGSSTLVTRLLENGFRHVAVLDVSEVALDRGRARSTSGGASAHRIVADATAVDSIGTFDVWHDRALFHFLISAADRQRYARLARATIPVGGHLIIAAFAKDGPDHCSGLPVHRYDAKRIRSQLGAGFELVQSLDERHSTPWGSQQHFVYAVLRRVPP